MILSGLELISKVVPWCPFCPPLLSVLGLRRLLFLLKKSVEGGNEELDECFLIFFLCNSSSKSNTFASNDLICWDWVKIMPVNLF